MFLARTEPAGDLSAEVEESGGQSGMSKKDWLRTDNLRNWRERLIRVIQGGECSYGSRMRRRIDWDRNLA
jgi:hypothetical protein